MSDSSGLQTEGRRLLCERVAAEKGGQSWLARLLAEHGAPIAQASVSAWCRGTSRPEPPMRKVLKALLRISPDAWDTEAESAMVAQAERGGKPPKPGVRRSRAATGTHPAVVSPARPRRAASAR